MKTQMTDIDTVKNAIDYAALALNVTRRQILDAWKSGDIFTVELIEAAYKRLDKQPLHA
jgi:hypothetical protein